MTRDEFSLLFHRSQVNLVAFKMLYEPEAFDAMHRMVEMAIAEEREECAKVCEAIAGDRHLSEAQKCVNAIRARGQE